MTWFDGPFCFWAIYEDEGFLFKLIVSMESGRGLSGAVKIFLVFLGLRCVCVLGFVFGFDCCFWFCLECVWCTFYVVKAHFQCC